MPQTTPFFKEFGRLLFGRQAVRSAISKLQGLESLHELYALFGSLLAPLLAPTEEDGEFRDRVFTRQTTFWAFVSQILSPDSSCRGAVRRVQAWCNIIRGKFVQLSGSTSAYCQARSKIKLKTLGLVSRALATNLECNVLCKEQWLEGRAVKIVDGTVLSMPDTPANQERWPQPRGQKPGCGFPIVKLLGLFSLQSGALLESTTSNQHHHESVLFRELWEKLVPGDVVLADRAFCSFAAFAALLKLGVDSVMRLHQARPTDFRQGRPISPGDRLVTWHKSSTRPKEWTLEDYAALPQTLLLRMIRLQVAVKGFRTKSVVIVTTLLDEALYPADKIRELYGKRWQVELHFQQIKTMLAMDVLRCKTPHMVTLEIAMHGIVYNLVRSLMQRSAHIHDVPLGRISFTGTLDTLRQWSPVIAGAASQPRKQQSLIDEMLALIAKDLVPLRPGRSEPRARKRRPKNYALLVKPRAQTGNVPRRSRSKKPNPRVSLS